MFSGRRNITAEWKWRIRGDAKSTDYCSCSSRARYRERPSIPHRSVCWLGRTASSWRRTGPKVRLRSRYTNIVSTTASINIRVEKWPRKNLKFLLQFWIFIRVCLLYFKPFLIVLHLFFFKKRLFSLLCYISTWFLESHHWNFLWDFWSGFFGFSCFVLRFPFRFLIFVMGFFYGFFGVDFLNIWSGLSDFRVSFWGFFSIFWFLLLDFLMGFLD